MPIVNPLVITLVVAAAYLAPATQALANQQPTRKKARKVRLAPPAESSPALQLPQSKPSATDSGRNQKNAKAIKLRVDSTLPASVVGGALESVSPHQNPDQAPDMKPVTRQIQDGEHSVKMDVKF